jgi:hypothetical protein
MSITSDNQSEVLILNGSVGAGKTAIALAIHDILSLNKVPHACLDLDQFSYSWPPVGLYNSDTVFAALEKVWPVYQAAGIQKLILARVVETREGFRRYSEILNDASITLCRIIASEKVRRLRLKSRESGESLQWHLNRTVELERIFESAALEDFVITNENEPIEYIAQKTLKYAKWLL